MKQLKLNNGYFALVDDDCYGILCRHTWRTTTDKSGVVRAVTKINGGLVSMPHLIISCEDGKEIDHINGNPLDNRSENLRACTHAQNMMNKKIYKNNKSGFKGVHKDRNVWRAQLRKNKQNIHLGQYQSPIDAAKAYNEAALIYFGKFARLNELPDLDPAVIGLPSA